MLMAVDPPKLLVRFREADGPLGVTRGTLREMAQALGVDETSAIHYALAQLKERVLPAYEQDDGPLTARQLREARSLVSQQRKPTSSLFGAAPRRKPKDKA
jgi:hypothetical protein